MIQHKFVSSWADLKNLSYEITFFKKSGWRVVKSDRLVNLPAPLLLNLDAREGWSLMEDDLNTYMEEHSQHVENNGEEAEENFVQPSNNAEFPYQQPDYDYGPSISSSS
jgi:hypothetical protein